MEEIKNILIIGLGAIGSVYATQFHDFDSNCVKILLDESRLKKYSENRFVVNDKKYEFNYILDTDTNYKADLILIATKSPDFENASKMIKNFVKEDTIIMSLLNGISSEEILFEKYGREKILYSYFIGCAVMRSGLTTSFDRMGTLVFGEAQNKKYSQNVQKVKDLFNKVGIIYQIPEDMISSLWKKFVINVGINQTSAALQAPYSVLQKSAYARKIANELMQEAVQIAGKLGIQGRESFIQATFELIDMMPSELKPSMLQDVEHKRETEVDIFAGEICRLGKKYNIPTPKNEFVLDIIKSVDERNMQGLVAKEMRAGVFE